MMTVTAGTHVLLIPKFRVLHSVAVYVKRITKLKHAACTCGGRSQEGDGGDCGRPEDRDREWDMGQPNPDFEHDFGNDDEPRDWDPKISGFTYFHI